MAIAAKAAIPAAIMTVRKVIITSKRYLPVG